MKMRHPEIDPKAEPAETSEAAFEEVWADLGWEAVQEDEPAPVAPTPAPLTAAERKAATEAAKAGNV